MLKEIEYHTNNSIEDEISICHQYLGCKCNFNHFDSADYQSIPATFAAMTTNDATENAEINNDANSVQFSQASSALHLKPPKYLESSFVLTLKQWTESKYDETLKVGTPGQKVRQKWMSESGLRTNFSKRKCIALKMMRVLAKKLNTNVLYSRDPGMTDIIISINGIKDLQNFKNGSRQML